MITYKYPVEILGIHDGDTVSVRITLGLGLMADRHVRLAGINAPELNTPGGVPARDHLAPLLSTAGPERSLFLVTPADHLDKYGRNLGWLVWEYPGHTWHCVNDTMVSEGHALPLPPLKPSPQDYRPTTGPGGGTASSSQESPPAGTFGVQD